MLRKVSVSARFVSFICLVLVAIISITVVSPMLSDPQFHSSSIEKIDDKKLIAMSMSAAVTTASVAISAIPDDVGSSVADELDDLTAILFAVVCILYFEKYMLTIMSFISFSFLLPAACLLFGINLYTAKESLKIWGTRLLALSLVLALIVPISVKFTKMLDETFEESVNQVFESVYNLVEEDSSTDENTNAFVKFFESVKDTVTGVVDAAKKMLSLFVDAVAVVIVTSCLVPILTVILFVYLIKTIFRVPMDVSKTMLSAHALIKGHLKKAEKTLVCIENPKGPEDHIAS